MDSNTIFNLIVTFLSFIGFAAAMITILFIATCFLGRDIKITGKTILAASGVILLQTIMSILGTFYEDQITGVISSLSGTDSDMAVAIGLSFIYNAAAFAYAFVFYLVIYKEKRFLRAVEASICLYGFYYYLNNIVELSIVYLIGGDSQAADKMANSLLSGESPEYTLIVVLADMSAGVLISLFLYLVMYRKKIVHIIKIRDRVLFALWIIVFSIIPSIPIYAGDLISDRYAVLSIMFGILIPVLGCLAPFILIMAAAERALKEKNEYQENYLKAELEYIEQYKRKQTETRAFRHDIINNLSMTSIMLEEGRNEAAKEHINELLGNVRSLSPEYVTGDEMLDIIVSMKADRMKEYNIRFTCDGVADGGLNMKPTDMCSVFANALDNAIEAALLSDDPSVRMEIRRSPKFFVIKITNSTRGRVDASKIMDSSGYTSKKDKEHHGFGIRNIEGAAEKYNGIIKAESEYGTFSLSIMIPRD